MFLSGLPESYKDKIQYDRPKNLKDIIWKETNLYEHNKRKAPYQKNWKDMKKNKQEQRKKGFHPSKFRNNNSYQQGQSKEDPSGEIPPVECWICKENHFSRQCLHKKNNLHNIQEDSNVGYVGGSVQRIYASLGGKMTTNLE